jgi:phosphoribosylformylglycinamidine synthase
MVSKPRVLIVTGHGVNCEAESRFAWETAGAEATLVHLHDLLEEPGILHGFRALMLIGGFSYGDHMGSGQVMAQRLRNRILDELHRYVQGGALVLGVCNGFQAMVKLGLVPRLPGDGFRQRVALMQNDCGTFQNFWVHLRFEPDSRCVFTRDLEPMPLPIRHGEGKVYTPDRRVLARLEEAGCVACRYVDPADLLPTQSFPCNPNGSQNAIAGLCDPSGRCFGLMPHPEAYLFPENHPQWDLARVRGTLPGEGLGLRLFRNAVKYLRQS